jgi:hypothetical protein
MNFYDALVAQAKPVVVEPSETSYFSAPGTGLDPRLFRSGKLIPAVRSSILRILFDQLRIYFANPEAYSHVWLAGSGVSYQWTAARNPADLDCLIGIDYQMFRQINQKYKGFSDKEIAATINEHLREHVQPMTTNFLGNYELTFYVNVQSNIKSIKPYAAYSLTNDDWTVQPEIKAPPSNKGWEAKVSKDKSMALDILNRYSTALSSIGSATTDVARRNAESALQLAVQQGAALFDDMHHGRTYAFSPGGQGYADIHNYRWQSGKSAGIVQALKKLKDVSTKSRKEFESQTYGMELPDADTLVRRALGYYNN